MGINGFNEKFDGFRVGLVAWRGNSPLAIDGMALIRFLSVSVFGVTAGTGLSVSSYAYTRWSSVQALGFIEEIHGSVRRYSIRVEPCHHALLTYSHVHVYAFMPRNSPYSPELRVAKTQGSAAVGRQGKESDRTWGRRSSRGQPKPERRSSRACHSTVSAGEPLSFASPYHVILSEALGPSALGYSS
jgi:hypothetical protein